MGADLYIEKINKPIQEKYEPPFEAAVRRRDSLPRGSKEAEAAQAEVTKYYDLMFSEGYFRDSYNVTCLLNWLGLSWWQDVIPLCTRARKLRQDKLRKFRDMVANATQLRPIEESDVRRPFDRSGRLQAVVGISRRWIFHLPQQLRPQLRQ